MMRPLSPSLLLPPEGRWVDMTAGTVRHMWSLHCPQGETLWHRFSFMYCHAHGHEDPASDAVGAVCARYTFAYGSWMG